MCWEVKATGYKTDVFYYCAVKLSQYTLLSILVKLSVLKWSSACLNAKSQSWPGSFLCGDYMFSLFHVLQGAPISSNCPKTWRSGELEMPNFLHVCVCLLCDGPEREGLFFTFYLFYLLYWTQRKLLESSVFNPFTWAKQWTADNNT